MDADARRTIAQAYTETVSPPEHHLRTFNKFLSDDAQAIIDEVSPVETTIDEGGETPPVLTEFGELQWNRPSSQEADGSRRDIYPQEARLRNLTYAVELAVDATISFQRDGQKYVQDEDTVTIGQLPVMVRSDACNLNNLTNDELVANGEDPLDPGGYFIINGTERVLLPSEDLVSNRITTEYTNHRGTQIPVAKTYSQTGNRRLPIVVKLDQENLLQVSASGYSNDLPFTAVIRALGLQTDVEITEQISDDKDIVKLVLGQLEEAEAETTDEALRKLGSEIAGNRDTQTQLERVKRLLDRDLLPHLNTTTHSTERIRSSKARFLCRMANACLELDQGKRRQVDKDHYANKRIRNTGELMKMVFRTALNRLTRDIDYQLKTQLDRGGHPSVSEVIRSDAFTNRLKRHLATGNWPGGRSGVSQRLDRRNHTAAISHLRRLKSPLSRSRPHFEARDLHATHWGRICPSETPEGPNCGLTKHFALSLELSTNSRSDEIVNQLEELGLRRSR